MKLLVLSDSHGNITAMERAVSLEQPDHILHLGDCVRDVRALEKKISVPITFVKGNCDFGEQEPDVLMPRFSGKKIFMTHGHLHGVKMMYLRAIYAALESEADILVFGHTHHTECFQEQGIWVLNPGSIGYGETYGLITLENREITCEPRRLP